MIRFKTETTDGTIRCPYCGKAFFLTGEKMFEENKKRKKQKKKVSKKHAEIIEHYEKLPEHIRICIGNQSYSGKEIAKEIRNNTGLGQLICAVWALGKFSDALFAQARKLKEMRGDSVADKGGKKSRLNKNPK